ncbi:MAG: response regulator [Phycisphaeraceae bacterium]
MVAAGDDAIALSGLKILLVEDNFLVAHMLKSVLSEMGCEVIGPAPTLEQGLRLAHDEELAGAILDINIIGGTSVPIAETLQRRRTPFFFISGYASPQMLPRELGHVRKLNKPIDETSLESAMNLEFVSD